MKAAVYTQYGSPEVLRVKEVTKPTPQHNEVLLKVHATAVNSGDWRLRKADPFAVRLFFGLRKPKIHILGGVFSGVVERVGENVTQFKPGDALFGHTDMRFGAYAEYMCVSEQASMVIKPTMLSHEEAAVIPFGAVTALHFLKKAAIKPGQKVLVVGASGAVGTAAVQLAKVFGADVTGVASTANMALLTALGADEVVDYTQEDFTRNGETYDVIFDTVKTINVSRSLKSLHPTGTMILSAAGLSEMLKGALVNMKGKQKVLTGVISHTAADMLLLKELIETGKLKPVIDQTYTLEDIAQAHAYAEKGHKKGNVAITV